MSAYVDENTKQINLTRGDSLYLDVDFETNGEPYSPVEGDTVLFALKKNIEDAECLIVKNIPTDTMVCHIEPGDTKNLDFGIYLYDIQLTTADGDVYTPIAAAKFKVTKEVY